MAAAAGVVPSTVSRALSKPGRVNHVTRERILKTAQRLGYTPNAAARSLRSGLAKMLLLLLPRWLSPIVSETSRGVEQELVRRGYGLVVGHQSQIATTERHLFELARSGLVDGILNLSGNVTKRQSERYSIFDTGIPVVGLLLDLSRYKIPSVTTNDREAMYEATKHLLDLGHKRFFYVGGIAGNYHEVERRKGMSECLKNAGINSRDIAMCHGDFLLQSGTVAAEQFLSLRKRPSGVVCCNDFIAIGFMKRVRSAGVRIPEDVAVVGFDGIEYGEYCDPTLTTCKQPTLELGKAGVRLLLDIIENKTESKASRIVLDSKLVVRGSTVKAALVPGQA